MSAKTLYNRLTLEVLGRVEAANLSPSQQPTSRKLLKSADTYLQSGVKYQGLGVIPPRTEGAHK